MTNIQEQMYVVFTIVQGICNYTEFNLLTAEEAKCAALAILMQSWKDDPLTNPDHPRWRSFIDEKKEEFERRKAAIEKLHCTDLDDEVDLIIMPVTRKTAHD